MGISPVYDAVHRAPWGGDLVTIGQTTLRETLGIDVMAKLRASVVKEHGREDGHEMVNTTDAVGEPNAGATLLAAMAVRVFEPGGEASHWRVCLSDP